MNLLPIKRHRVEVGQPEAVTVALVGCGGTGSFAALHLARLAYEVRRGGGPGLRLIFMDPDTVEEKNIGRQNFCPAEIGLSKAESLASRFGLAFGLSIQPVRSRFGQVDLVGKWLNQGGWGNSLLVVVGCVDSPAARAEIAGGITTQIKDCRGKVWWLDAGNDEHSGQVLLGNSVGVEPVIDPVLGCTGLPLPSVQEPGLIIANGQSAMVNEGLSCAELMAINAQSLMINQAMAGWVGVYVYRLLLGHDLDIYQTWVDLRGGATRSVAITAGVAAEVSQAPRPEARRELAELPGDAVGYCPECGELVFEGRDHWEGLGEEDIVFCPACNWRALADEWLLADEGTGENGGHFMGVDGGRGGPGRGVAGAVVAGAVGVR